MHRQDLIKKTKRIYLPFVGYKKSDGGEKVFQHRCYEHIPFHHYSS